MVTPETVIFACVHNAGRSQMAAAFFNKAADPSLARAISAGTAPADRVYPDVITAMREAGVDLSGAEPRLLTPEMAEGAAMLITMGCGEACPVVPGVKRQDWPTPDPKNEPLDVIREIRDRLRARVDELVRSHGWSPRAES